MKNIFVLVLVITIISLSSICFAHDFSDLGVLGDNYIEAIEGLVDKGVINGYPDGTFKPSNDVTRAELAKMIVTYFDLKGDTQMIVDFSDISNHWAKSYIETAALNGIIKGYEDHTFRPENHVSNGECAAMITRLLDSSIKQGEGKEWSSPYLAFLNEKGIINETISFPKDDNAKRDNVALILYNADKLKKDNNTPVPTKTAEPENTPIITPPTTTPAPTEKPSDEPLEAFVSDQLYVGRVVLEKQRAGIDYVVMDVFDIGEISFEVKKISTKPLYNSLVVFKVDKAGKVSIKRELKLSDLDDALLVEASSDGLISFKDVEPVFDLDADEYILEGEKIRIDLLDFIVVEMVDNKGTYEFDDGSFEEKNKVDIDEDDYMIFDSKADLCFVIKGIEE